MNRYTVFFEPTATGYSAHVPDLPGCVATGKTRKELLRNTQGAIEMHLDGLREEGLEIPQARDRRGLDRGRL